MNEGIGTAKGVFLSDESLYGAHGGQLEFVSVRIETRKLGNFFKTFAIIRFTDHDVRACEDAPVEKVYYELSFPLG